MRTYGTISLGGLDAPGIVVSDATGGFAFFGLRRVYLLDDLVVHPHAGRELRPQVD